MSRTYVDVHIIQDLPPANLNRDDNGTPKQAIYGGVDRLRVSSQAWKRATRDHFEASMSSAEQGVRTRRLHGLLAELIESRGVSSDVAAARAKDALGQLGIKADAKKEGFSSYLLFASRSHLEQLADALAGDDVDVKAINVKGILGSTHSLSVALFGRMVADLAELNVDAAAQVAHAISTHAAQTQFDYFTAVDDEQQAKTEETGAGMIGTIEFNSATMYRYATVGVEQLVDNMGDREGAIAGIGQFISSFASSMPSGKQNTFAAHTRPALIAVVIRDDRPVNLVSAFEQSVTRTASSGLLEQSMKALGRYASGEAERWGDRPRLVVASYAESSGSHEALTTAFGPSVPVQDLLRAVTDELTARGGAGD
ncbi:MAG: type I-E CRISPR-associated protein Cas7/Cse4/CasC [Phycicoccus sp.]|nr:type I-E CRISPR-associated protein Cas7/Cse4/CasC [Phycicoccus sp.]